MADPSLCFVLPDVTSPVGSVETVGNKAFNLMRLAQAGLPVPPAFVLPTSWCRARRHGAVDGTALRQALRDGIARLEAATGLGFGAPRRPLLVSVRSGGAVSMPGMMETVLDVGFTPQTPEALMRLTGNPRLAWDCYRRLVQGYAETVAALPQAPLDALRRDAIASARVDNERELDHRALRDLTQAMLDCYGEMAGAPFPTDPMEQLTAAADAVMRSWDAPKAAAYRRMQGLDDEAGTAVTVQAMVFGNAGGASGAGVGFTRDPATGANTLYVDFCLNGQGEDVVAGRHTVTDAGQMRRMLPDVDRELQSVRTRLETLFRDAQDFEFTVQDGRLFLLQCRHAQRTPLATLRIAVEMAQRGLITPAEALARVAGLDLDNIHITRFDEPLPPKLAQAVVAGVGVASGPIALDEEAAQRFAACCTPGVLVRAQTLTSDIAGVTCSAGLLTGAGSRTSHAAVVARQLNKVCLVGCPALEVDLTARVCRIGGMKLTEGAEISLDGNTGAVYAGRLAVVTEHPERELAVLAALKTGPTCETGPEDANRHG
jgi:pyruvate, orthophosphate dikinase